MSDVAAGGENDGARDEAGHARWWLAIYPKRRMDEVEGGWIGTLTAEADDRRTCDRQLGMEECGWKGKSRVACQSGQ